MVFVELDAKRVGRAIPGGVGSGAGGNAVGNVGGSGAGSGTSTETITSTTSSFASAITSTPLPNSSNDTSDKFSKKSNNPFDLQSKLVNFGSKYVGNAVKGMYGKLESEGFKAGDEVSVQFMRVSILVLLSFCCVTP